MCGTPAGTRTQFSSVKGLRLNHFVFGRIWLRGKDSNLRPLAYEANELPSATTPQYLIGARYQIRTGPFCLEGKHAIR